MPDDAALARAKEVVIVWHRKQWPHSNLDVLIECDYGKLVLEIAAALRAYGDERARQRAEEDARIADAIETEERSYQSMAFNMPGEKLAALAAHTAKKIAKAIRARAEKVGKVVVTRED